MNRDQDFKEKATAAIARHRDKLTPNGITCICGTETLDVPGEWGFYIIGRYTICPNCERIDERITVKV